MSDSESLTGNADRDRIRGLMARSAHAIAAAREGLDKSSTHLEDLSGAREPRSSKLKTRHFRVRAAKVSNSKRIGSKTPNAKSFPKQKILDTEHLSPKVREEFDNGKNVKDHEERGWLYRLRDRRAARAEETRDVTSYVDTEAFDALILKDDADYDDLNRVDLDRNDLELNDLDRDNVFRNELDQRAPWKNAGLTHEPQEQHCAQPEPERRSGPSVMVSWAQRLDALSNSVAGALIVTLLSFWIVGTGVPTPENERAVAQAETNVVQALASPKSAAKRAEANLTGMSHPTEDPMPALITRAGVPAPAPEKSGALHPSAHALLAAIGLRVLPTAFPKPLPPRPDDISTMHLWARASLPSVPGIAVLLYTDLPQVIPAMAPDIESQLLITKAYPRQP